MSVHAFVDESARRGEYIICVTTCPAIDLDAARRRLRGLRLPGQRRLHFADENDRRRRSILSKMATLGTCSELYVAKDPSARSARAAVIGTAVTQLARRGVRRLTLESREGQDEQDRIVIYRSLQGGLPLEYRHVPPRDEPLLWVPDAVAWAHGRGLAWRRTLDRLGLVAQVHRVVVA
jgi:hypothetical protein